MGYATPRNDTDRQNRRKKIDFFGHVSRMGSERLLAKVMHCHVSGMRNQERQPKKWIDNIKDDMETKNICLLVLEPRGICMLKRAPKLLTIF